MREKWQDRRAHFLAGAGLTDAALEEAKRRYPEGLEMARAAVMSEVANVRSNGAWPDSAVEEALDLYRNAVVDETLAAAAEELHVISDMDEIGGWMDVRKRLGV